MAFYRPGDPRWNRTIQHITENLEHANESAQENIYSFTQRYIDPCLSSFTQCANACTAPCFPTISDRRRHRGRARGREEVSFDFYDDWDDDEGDGLLGWGSDNIDRILGGGGGYGTINQPARQRNMTYTQRNRDPRYDTTRRKSTVISREGGQDPTLIPASSYFGFLDRLPFRIGGRGLRYKPSAADLTEHPGVLRRDEEEAEPLLEDSEDRTQPGGENKKHRRQRSDTRASAYTTDSLSSRGDIFPSEDELDDAVPLDDEFTISLERRTTAQWNEDGNSSKTRSNKSKRPVASRTSTHTNSSKNTKDSSGRESNERQTVPRSPSNPAEEFPTLEELQKEEERLRIEEEHDIEQRRQKAQDLAIKRGLIPNPKVVVGSPQKSPFLPSSSPRSASQMMDVSTLSPIVRSPASDTASPPLDARDFPSFVDAQTMPDSTSFHVDDSDFSSVAPSPRPLSLKDQPRVDDPQEDETFVPARLPHFGSG